ncbi:MAG: hypothetical protein MUO82_05440 [Candidatus Thermoplasmatota archaeon]|nr:hypothetical protein [Candidatus Thermoplasmatota archaeon]
MPYYCYICKTPITEGEYKYSNDVFGKALYRKHQDMERETSSPQNSHSNEPPQELIKQNTKPIKGSESKIGLKVIVKKLAVKTGQVIKKSVTTVTDTTRKAIQKRRWKDKILMTLEPKLIKQLAHENRIHLELVDKPTNNDYINAIKNDVSLDNIIAFAKRNYVNIRDVLAEIEELKIKEDNREIKNDGSAIKDFYKQVVEAIKLFQPSGSYENESPYHMQLLGYLKGKFPNAKIGSEEYRLSSRPDITIDGIAIEVKGLTGDRELEKIADKCLRYLQSHPKGMIIVLFNISASQYRYEEWLKNMNKQYPEVKIISK